MPHIRRNIACRNCSASIVLPQSIPQRISQHPAVWTMNAPKIALACPQCEHVYEYKLADYPANLSEGRDPYQDQNGLQLWCIELGCADSSCTSPVPVHIPLPASTTSGGDVLTRTARWTLHDIVGSCGHSASKLQQQ